MLNLTVEKVESKATGTLETASEKSQGSSSHPSRDCLPSRTLTREMFSSLGHLAARK